MTQGLGRLQHMEKQNKIKQATANKQKNTKQSKTVLTKANMKLVLCCLGNK